MMPTLQDLIATYGATVVNTLPSWLAENPALAEAYLTEMIDVQGGTSNPQAATNALEAIRTSPVYRDMYDAAFPGIRRDDGSLRMSEGTYLSEIQNMRSYVTAVGIDPTVFETKYADLISGDVSASEFGQRVNALYSGVIGGIPETGQWYADNYGIDLSNEAILGSLMDPELGTALLAGRITSAQIGGAAAARGFNIEASFAELLAGAPEIGVGEATRFFGDAATMLPVLNVLGARFADPDDDFDVSELASGMLFDDPTQRRRINRLLQQEASQFSGGVAPDFTRSRQTGGLSGLEAV